MIILDKYKIKSLPIVAPLSNRTCIVGILDRRLAQPNAEMPSPSTASGSAPTKYIYIYIYI